MKKAKKKGANEWNQVLEIHQNAMGTIRQTKKRSSDDEKAAKQKRWKRNQNAILITWSVNNSKWWLNNGPSLGKL